MPTLHSHTHCQAPRADAQTKACQRVCLSQRTAAIAAKLIDNEINKQNRQCLTRSIANKRFSGFRRFVVRPNFRTT